MMRTAVPLLIGLLALTLAGCGDEATLPEEAGVGPIPKLPAPKETVLPTVRFAKAIGWTAGQKPTPAPDLSVA